RHVEPRERPDPAVLEATAIADVLRERREHHASTAVIDGAPHGVEMIVVDVATQDCADAREKNTTIGDARERRSDGRLQDALRQAQMRELLMHAAVRE